MRSKSKIESEYNKLKLKVNALNEEMDSLDFKSIDYQLKATEEEIARNKMWILAWVLGYSKHL